MRRSERIRKLGTDSAVKGYEYTGAREKKIEQTMLPWL